MTELVPLLPGLTWAFRIELDSSTSLRAHLSLTAAIVVGDAPIQTSLIATSG